RHGDVAGNRLGGAGRPARAAPVRESLWRDERHASTIQHLSGVVLLTLARVAQCGYHYAMGILIDDLTIGQAKELARQFKPASDCITKEDQPSFWIIGQGYLIRTVTMIDTGILVAINQHEIILRDAAWVADTGRFSGALRDCEFNE